MFRSRLAGIFAAGAVLVALAGCNGGSSSPAPAPAPTTTPIALGALSIAVNGTLVAGVPTSVPVVVSAKDQNGNTIAGSYPSAITLSTNNTAGLTLSATSVTAPNANVTLAYDGRVLAGSPALTASAAGVTTASAPLTTNADNPSVAGSYTYTLTYSDVTTPASATPLPAFTGTSTYSVTVKTNASFNGQNNLIDVQTSRMSTPPPNATYTTSSSASDTYQGYVPANSGSYQLVTVGSSGAGSTSYKDGSSSTSSSTTVYTSPLVNDIVPGSAGRTWNGRAPSTTTSTYTRANYTPPSTKVLVQTSGTSKATYAVDGSYSNTSTSVYNNGQTTAADTLTVNPDASWSDVYTFGGNTTTWNGTVTNGTMTVTSGNAKASWPSWFPFGRTPQPLAVDTFTDRGLQPVPARCNLPAGVPTSARVLEDAYSFADPTYGYGAGTYRRYVAPGFGFVCSTTDETDQYFDGYSNGAYNNADAYTSTYSLQSVTASPSQIAARAKSFGASLFFDPTPPEEHDHLAAFLQRAQDHATRVK